MNLNPQAKDSLVETLENLLKVIKEVRPETKCAECDNFYDGYCEHWGDQVPPEHQNKHCEHWDHVPF